MKRLGYVALVLVTLAIASPAFAQEHGEAAGGGADWAKYIGAAIAITIAASFGSLGQGRSVAAACEAMGRNPGAGGAIRITMIIGLALIESLVIYSLVIAFLILNA
jgi:F-type H+-transporting ATPase subunit c